MLKTGVLLINLGTPDSPSVTDVRKYLREFLMDEKVIDIPFLNRWLLVNCIIAPFRSPKSAKEYKKVWTKKGSPLLLHGLNLKDLLQKSLGNDYIVSFGMRYQNPSIEEALNTFKNEKLEKLVIIPLYPQYSDATTGSTLKKVKEELTKFNNSLRIQIVESFVENSSFINSFAQLGKNHIQKEKYEHFVFSYHGLPERQINKASINNYCQLNNSCCDTLTSENHHCYRAQCFETTRRIAKKLNLKPEDYSICFQSRLGKAEWIKPYTEDILTELAKNGTKRVLAFSPAFVADCLETTIEVGEEYRDKFIALGGEKWDLVESLNTSPAWIDTLKEIVLDI